MNILYDAVVTIEELKEERYGMDMRCRDVMDVSFIDNTRRLIPIGTLISFYGSSFFWPISQMISPLSQYPKKASRKPQDEFFVRLGRIYHALNLNWNLTPLGSLQAILGAIRDCIFHLSENTPLFPIPDNPTFLHACAPSI